MEMTIPHAHRTGMKEEERKDKQRRKMRLRMLLFGEKGTATIVTEPVAK